jgi:hypothetical protein
MIEPHMILAILSLQNTRERAAGSKDEEAFYQRYSEPLFGRIDRKVLKMRDWFQMLTPARRDIFLIRNSNKKTGA